MSNLSPGSISQCLARLAAGDEEAVQKLWSRYFDQLTRVARNQIGVAPRRVFDEDDVVLSVFECLRNGAANGRFPEMRDRTDLWKILVTMTRQKVIDRIRREMAEKRGGKANTLEAAGTDDNRTKGFRLEDILDEEPTPDSLVALEEEKVRLMGILRDGSLRQVAVLRLEGYTHDEIATKLDVTCRTVERKLQLVRKAWELHWDK